MSLTANSSFSLDGRTPMEQVTGETPDISEYLDFGIYDWVWFKDNAGLGEIVSDDGSALHIASGTSCPIGY
jgi:hypothetical protein